MWGGFPDSLSLGGKRSGTKLAGRRCLRLLQASAGVFHGPAWDRWNLGLVILHFYAL